MEESNGKSRQFRAAEPDSTAPRFVRSRGRGWGFLILYIILVCLPLPMYVLARVVSHAPPSNLPPEKVEAISQSSIFAGRAIFGMAIVFLPLLISALHHLMGPRAKCWASLENRTKRHATIATALYIIAGVSFANFIMEPYTRLLEYHNGHGGGFGWVEPGRFVLNLPPLIIGLCFLAVSAKFYVGNKAPRSAS
jgi:hypothetical protein